MCDKEMISRKIILMYVTHIKSFILSFVVGFFVHAVKFSNYLPTWDSIRMIDKSGEYTMVEYGRWFAYITTYIFSTPFDLQWVSGIVSLLFLSASIIILLEIFEIENISKKIATICLFMVFPSITATCCYMTWTAAYSFSIFLAFIALYIVIYDDTNTGLFFSAINICLSMGIYQIYVTTIIVGFIYYLIYLILSKRFKSSYIKIKRFVISILIGGTGYIVINKCVLNVCNITMDSYQGLDSIGLMNIEDIFISFKKLIKTAGYFYLGANKITIFGVIDAVILMIFIFIILKLLICNRYTIKEKCGLVVLIILSECFSYAFLFVSRETHYHMLMQIGNFFTYYFIILICDKEKIYMFKNRNVRNIATIFIFILCFYHYLNANIAYKQMEMSFQKTSFEIQEVLMKIDSISVDGNEKLALFGIYAKNNDLIYTMPAITGASTSNFVESDIHFYNFTKYYYERTFEIASEDEKRYIEKKDAYKEMDCYPYGSYVKKIDDYIVVKFENYE